jgi:hypothetical protein
MFAAEFFGLTAHCVQCSAGGVSIFVVMQALFDF